MNLSDFDYHLPKELIAKEPLAERSGSRLLHLTRHADSMPFCEHRHFKDIVDLINPEDLVVFNNTKVIPARIYGQKASGGKVECLIERIISPQKALAHLRASRSPKPGSEIIFADYRFNVTGRDNDLFLIELIDSEENILAVLEKIGQMPLPPYMEREAVDSDNERYQTVYAKHDGSVAAPTAGLHFDDQVLQALTDKGVSFAYVTLHVGAGTFQPVKVEDITSHHMHAEYIDVSENVCQQVKACHERGGRVVAVGTTSVRSLESAAAGGVLKPMQGDTDIFIYPGFEFKVVDALITNFHLPKSTLLMLISAFAGYEQTMAAYQQAVAQQYRFFSYGDAMFIA